MSDLMTYFNLYEGDDQDKFEKLVDYLLFHPEDVEELYDEFDLDNQ